MIELRISHTCREAGRGKDWYRLGDTTEHFATLQDTASGGARRVGRVYHTREREAGRTYYRNYWVSAYEYTLTPALL